MAQESSIGASSVSGQRVNVPTPNAGETLTFASAPGSGLVFAFDPATATVTRSGNNLVFAVDDGGTVIVSDFFVTGGQDLPSLTLPNGETVASAEFLASFDIEFETTAGPGTGAAGSGADEYADDAGTLVAGIDRLGSLETGQWDYEPEALNGESIVLPGAAPVSGVRLDIGDDAENTLPGDGDDLAPKDEGNTTLGDGDDSTSTGNKDLAPGNDGGSIPDGGEHATALYAFDNRQDVSVTTGARQIESGTTETIREATEPMSISCDKITGDLKTHNSSIYKKCYGITSSSGDIDAVADYLGGIQTEQGAFNILDCIPAGTKTNGSSIGAVSASISITEDGGDFTANWTMYPSNSGVDNNPDVSFALLYKIGEDGAKTLVEVSSLQQYQTKTVVKNSETYEPAECSHTWTNLEVGQYEIVYIVVESDTGNGQKTILAPGEAEYAYTAVETVALYEDVDTFVLAAGGNVIEDPSANPGDNQAQDHHSDGQAFAVTHVSCVFFGGYDAENPAPVDQGTFTGTYDGNAFTFTIESDGSYSFKMEGDGTPPSLDDLNIRYFIATPDGETADATLSLTSGHTGPDAATASVHSGLLPGTDGVDIIQAGAGNDVMHGGDGQDIFVWKAGDFDGGADTIIGFSLSDGDVLSFEGLTDLGEIGISFDNNVLTLSIPSGDSALTVEVNFQEGEVAKFTQEYAETHGSSEILAQDLFNAILIQNATGGC